MIQKITTNILVLLILTTSSCGLVDTLQPEPDPSVKMTISYIGYSHVDYKVQYTTYNEISENGVKPSEGSASILLTDSNGDYFYAVAAQPFQYTDIGYGFNVTFCDLMFINDAGTIITLSANLEGV